MKSNNINQMIMFIAQSTYDSPKFLVKSFITSEGDNYISYEEINIKIEEGGWKHGIYKYKY
jgi:hypothetical protein